MRNDVLSQASQECFHSGTVAKFPKLEENYLRFHAELEFFVEALEKPRASSQVQIGIVY